MFGVRQAVLVPEDEAARNGLDIPPGKRGIRVFRGNIRGRKNEREGIPAGRLRQAIPTGIVGSIEEWRSGGNPKYTIGGITNFQELAQVFDRGVVDTKTHADAGLSWSTGQFRDKAFAGIRRIGQTKTRREGVVLGRRQSAGNTWIAGDEPSLWSGRKNHGLDPGNNGFGLVLGVIPGLAHFPAQTIVERETRFHAPTVLDKEPGILCTGIEDLVAGLNEAVGSADEEIHKITSSFAAVESEGSVLTEIIALVDLVVVKLSAKPEAVRADDFGETVLHLIGVVVLAYGIRWNANDEIVEGDIWNAFEVRGYRTYAAVKGAAGSVGVSGTVGGNETKGTQSVTEAALWLEELGGVASKADVKFVERSG